MKVSVVVCSHSDEMYEHLVEAVDSLLNQSYEDVEVVVVVDGSDALHGRVAEKYEGHDDVEVVVNEENLGLSASRNRGVEASTGDVVAFMDDDAVADERWVEELVSTYEERDVEAVGGRMTPIWVAGEPGYLPEEFHWLVGVTHRGFPGEGEVRNTFGSNMSFRREVLEKLDGFDEDLGRKGDRNVQGEETELAARMRRELDGTFYYDPDAMVGHKVFDHRTGLLWLLKRAFWQGYSKRAMEVLVPEEGIGEEGSYLRFLLTDATARRLREGVLGRSPRSLLKLVMIYVFTAFVGFGYLYGFTRWR